MIDLDFILSSVIVLGWSGYLIYHMRKDRTD